jgi:hypothetical protein
MSERRSGNIKEIPTPLIAATAMGKDVAPFAARRFRCSQT